MSNFKSQISQTYEEDCIRDKTEAEVSLLILHSRKADEKVNI